MSTEQLGVPMPQLTHQFSVWFDIADKADRIKVAKQTVSCDLNYAEKTLKISIEQAAGDPELHSLILDLALKPHNTIRVRSDDGQMNPVSGILLTGAKCIVHDFRLSYAITSQAATHNMTFQFENLVPEVLSQECSQHEECSQPPTADLSPLLDVDDKVAGITLLPDDYMIYISTRKQLEALLDDGWLEMVWEDDSEVYNIDKLSFPTFAMVFDDVVADFYPPNYAEQHTSEYEVFNFDEYMEKINSFRDLFGKRVPPSEYAILLQDADDFIALQNSGLINMEYAEGIPPHDYAYPEYIHVLHGEMMKWISIQTVVDFNIPRYHTDYFIETFGD